MKTKRISFNRPKIGTSGEESIFTKAVKLVKQYPEKYFNALHKQKNYYENIPPSELNLKPHLTRADTHKAESIRLLEKNE
ncbi:MAG: hypothetical protein ABIH83_03735 [Candidatus Micrarchaeota archaeon]